MVTLDKSFLELRYRSVYSAHLHELSESSESDEEEAALLLGRLPSLGEEEVIIDEEKQQRRKIKKQMSIEKEPPVDPHAAGLGGSLSSATLGIIKGMVGPAILRRQGLRALYHLLPKG